MKQSQNARKQRGRSASRKTGKSNNSGGNRNEPKVRGNPKQLLEKYKNQAREAKQSGDRVLAEYYYQFADHYQRMLNDMGVRSSNARGDENASDDSNSGDDQQQNSGQNNGQGNGQNNGQGNGQRKPNRSRRSRGQNPDHSADQQPDQQPGSKQDGETTERAEDKAAVDPTDTEQPVEVHPELDLDGTAAAPEEAEKPKRRRAPARRRTPRTSEAGATASETDAAPADAPASSGDNEAA